MKTITLTYQPAIIIPADAHELVHAGGAQIRAHGYGLDREEDYADIASPDGWTYPDEWLGSDGLALVEALVGEGADEAEAIEKLGILARAGAAGQSGEDTIPVDRALVHDE